MVKSMAALPDDDKTTSPVYAWGDERPIYRGNSLDFYAALKAIADGKKVTKLEWSDNRIYGVLVDGKLMLRKPDADYEFYPWTISDDDIAGTDWVIIP
jgi:hypothetical protein